MDIPKLKLKFSLTQITHLEPKAVIDLLASILKEKEYKILEETNNSLTFYNNPWMPRWNFQRYIALNGGIVEVENSGNEKLIRLNYYIDFLPLLLLVGLLLISTISDHQYDATLFFACFYIVATTISIVRAKMEAKKILKEIHNGNGVN